MEGIASDDTGRLSLPDLIPAHYVIQAEERERSRLIPQFSALVDGWRMVVPLLQDTK